MDPLRLGSAMDCLSQSEGFTMFPRRFSGRRLLRLRFGDNHPVADLCETSDIQSLANHLPELAGFADLALLCPCFRKEFGRNLGTHWLTQTSCGVRLVQRRDVDLRLPDGLLFPESSSHAFIRELCVTLSVGDLLCSERPSPLLAIDHNSFHHFGDQGHSCSQD